VAISKLIRLENLGMTRDKTINLDWNMEICREQQLKPANDQESGSSNPGACDGSQRGRLMGGY
jgi:hypothetical protein